MKRKGNIKKKLKEKKSSSFKDGTEPKSEPSLIFCILYLPLIILVVILNESLCKIILSILLHEKIYLLHMSELHEGAFIFLVFVGLWIVEEIIRTKSKNTKRKIIWGALFTVIFCYQTTSFTALCENDIVIKSGLTAKSHHYSYSDKRAYLSIFFYYWHGKSPGPRISFNVGILGKPNTLTEFAPDYDSYELEYCAKVYSKLKDRSTIDVSDEVKSKYKKYIKSLNAIIKPN